jgi:hypothetical protein
MERPLKWLPSAIQVAFNHCRLIAAGINIIDLPLVKATVK